MSRKLIALFLCLTLALSAAALADESVIRVTDMFGRETTLAEPATRIVVLTASDCEILCALGCEDAIVGRGQYCDYPASILDVPVVLSGAEMNIEEVLALEPQIIVMGDMAHTREQVAMLERSGVKVVISNANDIEGTYTAIRMIGTLMGRDAEAEALIAEMQSVFAQIAANSPVAGRTVYFEVTPLQWGLWTAGNNTFMNELAGICGMTNVFADVDGWAAISEEQVLMRNPDYIVSVAGTGDGTVEEIMSRPGWDEITAVKNGHVFNADSNAIARPGPRLMDAAKELYAFFYVAEE